jgi:hypothetical protein
LNLDNTIEINKEKWIKTELVDWAISRMQWDAVKKGEV